MESDREMYTDPTSRTQKMWLCRLLSLGEVTEEDPEPVGFHVMAQAYDPPNSQQDFLVAQ